MNRFFTRAASAWKTQFGRLVREVGIGRHWIIAAFEKRGSLLNRDMSHTDALSRHRKIVPVDLIIPEFCESTSTICDSATLVGNVKVGKNSTVGYGVVLRGDDGPIRLALINLESEITALSETALQPLTMYIYQKRFQA